MVQLKHIFGPSYFDRALVGNTFTNWELRLIQADQMKILKNTFQSIFKAKITHSQFKVHRHKTYTIYSRTLERIFFQASSLLQYFCLVLGILKSRVSKKQKTIEPLGRKPNFKLFHYKARVQPVSLITTIYSYQK